MLDRKSSKLGIGGLFLCLAAVSGNALADNVKNAMEEAMEYYEDGAYRNAVESLNYASKLIQELKGKQLEALLPEVDGWNVTKAESKSIASSVLGGGVTVEGFYLKDTSAVNLKIITDSPMMQAIITMISNPAIAIAGGGTIQEIASHQALVEYDATEQVGEIKMVVDETYLITIEAKNVSKETLMGFAEAIDYKKLSAL